MSVDAQIKDLETELATLQLPRFDAGIAALRQAGCGSVTLLPVAPRAGQPAKRVLIRARKSGRAPARLLAPLILHQADGSFTEAAEDVLRRAAALAME